VVVDKQGIDEAQYQQDLSEGVELTTMT